MTQSLVRTSVLMLALSSCGGGLAFAQGTQQGGPPLPSPENLKLLWFTYDAKIKSVRPPADGVKHGQPVRILIVQPDTLRETYGVGVKSTDFHATPIPDALKRLFASGPTTSSDLSIQNTIPLRETKPLQFQGVEPGAGAEARLEILPQPLLGLSKEARVAAALAIAVLHQRALNDILQGLYPSSPQPKGEFPGEGAPAYLDARLDSAIGSSYTNESRRYSSSGVIKGNVNGLNLRIGSIRLEGGSIKKELFEVLGAANEKFSQSLKEELNELQKFEREELLERQKEEVTNQSDRSSKNVRLLTERHLNEIFKLGERQKLYRTEVASKIFRAIELHKLPYSAAQLGSELTALLKTLDGGIPSLRDVPGFKGLLKAVEAFAGDSAPPAETIPRPIPAAQYAVEDESPGSLAMEEATGLLSVPADWIAAYGARIADVAARAETAMKRWETAYATFQESELATPGEREIAYETDRQLREALAAIRLRASQCLTQIADFSAHCIRAKLLFQRVVDRHISPRFILMETSNAAGDEVAIRVETTEKLSPWLAAEAKEKPENVLVSKWVRDGKSGVFGRQVLDFSSGLVVTNLLRENYYGVGTSPSGTIEKGVSDQADVQPGLMAHWYSTQKSGVVLAPSLGLTVGEQPRILAGLSLIHGSSKNSRFYLTGGLAFGDVARINSPTLLTGSNLPDVRNVKRFGSFISLQVQFSIR